MYLNRTNHIVCWNSNRMQEHDLVMVHKLVYADGRKLFVTPVYPSFQPPFVAMIHCFCYHGRADRIARHRMRICHHLLSKKRKNLRQPTLFERQSIVKFSIELDSIVDFHRPPPTDRTNFFSFSLQSFVNKIWVHTHIHTTEKIKYWIKNLNRNFGKQKFNDPAHILQS